MSREQFSFISQDIRIGASLVTPDSGTASIGATCITGGGGTAEEMYGEWQVYLASEGVASLAFNARGMGQSQGEWSTGQDAPAPGAHYNSQYSRCVDTFQAVKELRDVLGTRAHQAIIGRSMGGDVAIRASNTLSWAGISLCASVLLAPAAYNETAHWVSYGSGLHQVLHDRNLPADKSINFAMVRHSLIPTMLIFARGDTTIPVELLDHYRQAVEAAGGEVLDVGDVSTKHQFFTESDTASKAAKKLTIERSTHFILEHANR